MATVVEEPDPDERGRVAALVLADLPRWFGLEDSNAEYVRRVRDLPTWVARDDGAAVGFLALERHTPYAAEIHVMGVLRSHHRRGLGRALVDAAATHARSAGCEFLTVKTLGPSHPSEAYAATRRFYEAVAFRPIEELHGLWPGNPCLILVRPLR